jgi:RNA-binding protein YhbY
MVLMARGGHALSSTPLNSRSTSLESIPPSKLRELRRTGLEMKDVIKLGRLGVGEGVIYQIRNRWKTSEIAKLYCGGKAGINMKEIVDRLEEKTGGIVVHRAGGSVFLYRADVDCCSDTSKVSDLDN